MGGIHVTNQSEELSINLSHLVTLNYAALGRVNFLMLSGDFLFYLLCRYVQP
jgi:hypothetical protein